MHIANVDVFFIFYTASENRAYSEMLDCVCVCLCFAVGLEMAKISIGLNPEMECTSTFYLVRFYLDFHFFESKQK